MPMHADTIEIVPFAPSHLEGAQALSRQAGWPHRIEDWALVLSLSVGIVALVQGRVAGTAMTTPYGNTCAAISLVIVDEALRGRGLGRKLTAAALAAGEREFRLTSTADGLPLYENLGFVRTHEIFQHQGTAGAVAVPERVAWAGPEDLTAVAAIDRQPFGADRGALLEALAREGRFAVLRSGDGVTGYGVLRRFGRGEVIGPVVARNEADARALVAFLASSRAGSFLRVDTPDPSFAAWLAGLGLTHVGGGIAMRRGKSTADVASGARAFALASQALG